MPWLCPVCLKDHPVQPATCDSCVALGYAPDPADDFPACHRCQAQVDVLIGLGGQPGVPVEWLCGACLEDAMRELGEKIRRIVKARLN